MDKISNFNSKKTYKFSKINKTTSEKIIYIIVFVLLLIFCLGLLYPFFFMIINALKSADEYMEGNTLAFPRNWLFSNFARAINELSLDDGTTFYDMIFNSLWYTVLASFLASFMASITGYCLAMYKFKGRNFIYGTAIFCMTVPIVGTMGAYFKLITDLNIMDTPLYVVVTHMGSWGTYFIIMYGYFRNMSWSYAEAVFMDGGNHFTVFFKVMLPQATGPLITLFVISSIANWNDYMTMLLYLPSYQTLASGLYNFQVNQLRGTDYPIYYSGLIMSLVPVVILFAGCSNIIMKNMSVGGLKG